MTDFLDITRNYPGCSMNLHEKIHMARQLESLCVDIIEAGFPIASEGDFRAVQAIANECETAIVELLNGGMRIAELH